MRTLLRNGVDQDIILPDGDYILPVANPPGSEAPFINMPDSDRIWAQNLGGARLHFAINMRGANAELQGLTFLVDNNDDSIFVENAERPWLSFGVAVNIENGATRAAVHDCIFDGGGVMGIGILVRETERASLRRLRIDNFIVAGIRVADYPFAASQWGPGISDVVVAHINDPHNPVEGIRESGLAIESKATLVRIQVRDVAGTGIVVGTDPNTAEATRATMRFASAVCRGLPWAGIQSVIGTSTC